ncbi:hypothetical protein [Xylophilus sp. GOD-11R]|uniref:DoxX family protein n=1 Tax=Xylophilus sp. GOD-11R TaxID=3089814 RepID=UPI00298D4665|nr:hypothetical protein [Xylophilus sp. GOD-11R]WPB55211.1 hypothetical protein R9X41_13720 [Xylophilus sp. GOD-11R]
MMDARPLIRRKKAGLSFVFIWFLVGGLAHFLATEAEMRIVPAWIPWPREVVLVSGGLELLGAMGILWRWTRRWAGGGLAVLTLAVTPANVFMLQHAADFPAVPYWLLVVRLPLQVALLALILWSTADPSRRRARVFTHP